MQPKNAEPGPSHAKINDADKKKYERPSATLQRPQSTKSDLSSSSESIIISADESDDDSPLNEIIRPPSVDNLRCDACNINELHHETYSREELSRHQKLYHDVYDATECPKCSKRFMTITEMENDADHKINCQIWKVSQNWVRLALETGQKV